MNIFEFISEHLWFSFFIFFMACITLDSMFGDLCKIFYNKKKKDDK